MMPGLTVTQITVGAFQENCYIVSDSESEATAIVDPGSDGDRIIAEVERQGRTS